MKRSRSNKIEFRIVDYSKLELNLCLNKSIANGDFYSLVLTVRVKKYVIKTAEQKYDVENVAFTHQRSVIKVV